MNTEKIKQLLERYFDGDTTLEEEERLRNFFQNEEVSGELKSYRDLFKQLQQFAQAESGEDFNPFEKIDAAANDSPRTSPKEVTAGNIGSAGLFERGSRLNSSLTWTMRIAAGLILLLVGFSAGLLMNQQQVTGEEVAALQQEVQQMKTALVYGSGQKLTASERITAVNISARIPGDTPRLDGEITDILIHTLNSDRNVNVREAAAEALFRFRTEPRIRKALVNSLSLQDNPLMQMTLINMLVEIKEKSAINEMQRMLLDADTREVVKARLKMGIAELKT